MANRSRGRAGRPRKRRPSAAKAAGEEQAKITGEGGRVLAGTDSSVPGPQASPRQASRGPRNHKRPRPRGASERSGGGWRDPLSVGERPQAPWHPLPLSELLILVGALGTVFGLRGGVSNGGPALFAGIAAVLVGTVEVTLREHSSGYRSHTLILTLLPVIVFHSAVILVVADLTRVPKSLNILLLLIDAALGTFLFKLLRARYLDARRERTFARRR